MAARQIPGGAYVDGTTSRQIPDGPYVVESGSSDVTAPLLTVPTGIQTGSTTASGTVTTDEGNGTLYFLATVNLTENAATVKTGSLQAVSSTGSQSVTFSGLTASTTYYAHYVHRDASGNDSLVANSSGFTTAASGDTTAPTLTGTLVASAVTATSYTLTWPSATDNVAVTGYEYSLDGGTSYTQLGVVLTVNVTGRTPGATDATRVRAFDGAGNRSNPALSASVTLNSASVGTITPSPIKNNTSTIQGSIANIQVKVYSASGVFVVEKVISSDSSGNIPFSDSAITAGATYYGLLVHPASGAFGSFKVVAT